MLALQLRPLAVQKLLGDALPRFRGAELIDRRPQRTIFLCGPPRAGLAVPKVIVGFLALSALLVFAVLGVTDVHRSSTAPARSTTVHLTVHSCPRGVSAGCGFPMRVRQWCAGSADAWRRRAGAQWIQCDIGADSLKTRLTGMWSVNSGAVVTQFGG